MSHNVPGNGGSIRPSEYFDIIGASGPNALLALLFVRFVSQVHAFEDVMHRFMPNPNGLPILGFHN
jgi:hypothetical protein